MFRILGYCNRLMIAILLAIVLLCNGKSHAQEGKSEREYVEFICQAKEARITSFVTLKSGCWGCEVVYTLDEKKTAINNVKQITLIYQAETGCKNITFYDYDRLPEESDIHDCSIFDYILNNKKQLMRKETFYKKIRKTTKFVRPISPHHFYEEIDIDTKEIQYSFYMVKNSQKDHLSDIVEQKWQQITTEIATRIKILNTVKTK